MAWHVLEPAAELKWGWCLDAICEHLQAVHDGRIKRLLMNVPPGCMKSLTTGVLFPAWEWGPGARSDLRFLTTAHKETLAIRDNMKCRRLIQSDWFQERWPVKLTGDQNAKSKFENTATGFRESMSFTSLTGSRGDRVIIDDPLSVDDAFSEAALQAAEDTFLEAVPSRVNNADSAIIVIMQRLHERDTSGIILANDLGYEHLMLPMRFESNRRCVTSIGFRDPRTRDGELLFPERFGEQQVREMERTMGSYACAGQLQQRPVPRGGGLFKLDWIQHWTAESLPKSFEKIVISWDMTFKKSDSSDYVVGQVWAREGANFYLLDQVRDRWDFVQTRAAFQSLAEKWPKAHRKLVEDKANGPAIISELKNKVAGIIPITPKESKEARASSVTTLWEAHNVFLPPPDLYPWVKNTFLPELLAFPAGAHDDQCFAAGTLVATIRGDVPIEKIRANDLVVTPFGFRRVVAAGMTGQATVIKKFGLRATPNHPFITSKNERIEFKHLRACIASRLTFSEVFKWKYQRMLCSMGLSTPSCQEGGITSVNQIQTQDEKILKDCMLQFGNIFQERKYLLGMRFITKTATLLITTSAILSVYQFVNTARQPISKLKKFASILTRFGISLLPGTRVKKAESGIEITLGKKKLQKNAHASTVEPSFFPSELMPSIAAESVRFPTVTTTRQKKSNESVRFVENHSKHWLDHIDTHPTYAASHAELNGDDSGKVPVFNLTIEKEHVFYANGFLVHNCDAMSQALHDLQVHKGWTVSASNRAALRALR